MAAGLRSSVQLVSLDCSSIMSDLDLQGVLKENNLQVVEGSAWDGIRPAVEQTVAVLNRLPRSHPWGSYLMADPDTREVVGICGFKTAPSEGQVEIAYFTFPPYEGRGYATSAAFALTALAESSHEVQTVIAHTLMEPNSSTRVLTRCGFSLVGEVFDPEDGRIWRWERSRQRGAETP